jgi:hypothetical protein
LVSALGVDLLAQIRIECRPVGQRQNFSGVGIFHDHRAGNRLRVVNRLIQFFFGDVLNVLVDGQDQVLARAPAASRRRRTIAGARPPR